MPRAATRKAAVGPGDFPPFRPRPPWLGGDLQTVRNRLRRDDWPTLAEWPGKRLCFPTDDGSGDVLSGMYHAPAEPDASARPLVILMHGLTGCEDSSYMRYTARLWLRRGHPVLRLNLRGAGPSRPHCRRLYHAGLSPDLGLVLARLHPAFAQAGAVAIGFSLGGNILLKYLAEAGVPPLLRAAATVSAPIDLAVTSRRVHAPRNRLYMRWFARGLRRNALDGPGLDAAERRRLARVRTMRGFDEAYVAPRAGFRDADDYYARTSALPLLGRVRVPTLLVHAGNDPWIPLEMYRRVDWRANPALVPLLGAPGGHVGFHARGCGPAWHDRCIAAFFDRVLREEPGVSRP